MRIDPASLADEASLPVPGYLERHYWWAYVRPGAVRVFERQWLVNCILWGNFSRLRDAALDLLGDPIRGRTLQVACVYGDLTPRLLARTAPGLNLHLCDSSDLPMADGHYDQVLVFFLLHEQPEETRRRTIAEALRVVRPGGRVVFVDYHRPGALNPLRLVMSPVLRLLEPFATDLWRREIADWLPASGPRVTVAKRTFFGGLYQLTVMTRASE